MTHAPINNLYGVAVGTATTNVFVDIFLPRDPTSHDTQYQLQKKWYNTTNGNYWILSSFSTVGGYLQAVWTMVGGGSFSGFDWITVTNSTQLIATGKGYFANASGGVTFTLPASASEGATFTIAALNSAGWTIQQNTSQSIQFGDVATTPTSGSLTSTAIGNTVTIVCSVANTGFFVTSSMGRITIV